MIKKIKSYIPIKVKSNIKNYLKYLKTRSLKELNSKQSYFSHNSEYSKTEALNREIKIHNLKTEHTESKNGIWNNVYEFKNSVGYFLDNEKQVTNLIDIGSGTGWFVNYVSLNYPALTSIFAIEPSSAAINISKKIYGKNKNIQYLNGFADKEISKLEKDIYLVTTFAVFQHLNTTYTKKVLNNLNNILEKGSILYLNEPIANSKLEKFRLHYPRTEKFWIRSLRGYDVSFYDRKIIVAQKNS
jgi:SAM-dependent methyltransferase|tara:strand:- start:686 stop:1414 length:729 start_codon:yes stop_codon:yes gene_type:complete